MCRKDEVLPTGQDEEEGAQAEGPPRAVEASVWEGVTSTCGNSFCLRAISPFPLLAQMEQQMKCVSNVLGLRGAFFCRSGILSSPIAANDFNFRVS